MLVSVMSLCVDFTSFLHTICHFKVQSIYLSVYHHLCTNPMTLVLHFMAEHSRRKCNQSEDFDHLLRYDHHQQAVVGYVRKGTQDKPLLALPFLYMLPGSQSYLGDKRVIITFPVDCLIFLVSNVSNVMT